MPSHRRSCRLISAPDNSRRGGVLAWVDDPGAPWNAHAEDPAILKATLAAALYPQVAAQDSGVAATKRPTWFDSGSAVAVHPSCCVHSLLAHQYAAPFLAYSEKMRTSQTFLRDVTVVPPMALLLFGGKIEVHHSAGYLLLDGWLKVRERACCCCCCCLPVRYLASACKYMIYVDSAEVQGFMACIALRGYYNVCTVLKQCAVRCNS